MSKNIDAHIIRPTEGKNQFLRSFLLSPDFETKGLRNICRKLGLTSSGNKNYLADSIYRKIVNESPNLKILFEEYVRRPKTWLALKYCADFSSPILIDPTILAFEKGAEEWYGPIKLDDGSIWYLRPRFVPHHERVSRGENSSKENIEYIKSDIRWIVCARFYEGFVSLHWRNFSHLDDAEEVGRNNRQNKFWLKVPGLFTELENLVGSQFQDPPLDQLVLKKMWQQYRIQRSVYEWKDLRIRAEGGGVSFSARSRSNKLSDQDIDIQGIHRLAQVIRKSIFIFLEEEYKIDEVSPENMDQLILDTFIQDVGPISYEFELNKLKGEKYFKGHIYFGNKPTISRQDSFPHIKVNLSYGANWNEQLQFLIDELKYYFDGSNSAYQPSLYR